MQSIDRVRHDDDGKGKEITRNFTEVLDGLKLDQDHGQRIVHKAGDFRRGLQKLLQTLSEPVFQFANEVTQSNYVYPKGYIGLKTIEVQIAAISVAFGLDSAKALEYAKHLPELPEGAEGWGAVPNLTSLAAKHFANLTDPKDQYCAAVNMVLKMLGDSRAFTNYRDGQLTSNRFRQSTRSIEMLEKIAKMQGDSEILLIPIQFGMKYRGHSVRCGREKMEDTANEFGLGAFIVGCLLLTHPEREEMWEQLHCDCAGDEFDPDGNDQFDNAPVFGFNDGRLRFGACWVSIAFDHDGSVSGFLPAEA